MYALEAMLIAQNNLQRKMPGGKLPGELTGDERAEFLRWNMFALEDELHEAMQETGWKPWATSRHMNAEAMLKEMVDAWHFFMNVLLVIAGEKGWDIETLASNFFTLYREKNATNAQRQEEGYDGVKSKCKACHRELDLSAPYTEFCSTHCFVEYNREENR